MNMLNDFFERISSKPWINGWINHGNEIAKRFEGKNLRRFTGIAILTGRKRK